MRIRRSRCSRVRRTGDVAHNLARGLSAKLQHESDPYPRLPERQSPRHGSSIPAGPHWCDGLVRSWRHAAEHRVRWELYHDSMPAALGGRSRRDEWNRAFTRRSACRRVHADDCAHSVRRRVGALHGPGSGRELYATLQRAGASIAATERHGSAGSGRGFVRMRRGHDAAAAGDAGPALEERSYRSACAPRNAGGLPRATSNTPLA